jgi:hypothetical protein
MGSADIQLSRHFRVRVRPPQPDSVVSRTHVVRRSPPRPQHIPTTWTNGLSGAMRGSPVGKLYQRFDKYRWSPVTASMLGKARTALQPGTALPLPLWRRWSGLFLLTVRACDQRARAARVSEARISGPGQLPQRGYIDASTPSLAAHRSDLPG